MGMEYQILAFPGGIVVKNPPANAGDGSPGGRNDNPLQYSCWDNNPMDRGAWRATLHGVTMT